MGFKENLQKRMKDKGIDFRGLAKLICNYGSNEDLWEKLQSKEKVQKARKVSKWLSGDSKPNIDNLEIICDILDCNIAFLMDESPIENINNKKVAEYLGIDENTVSAIKNYESSLKKMIDKLVFTNKDDNKMEDILRQVLIILSLDCYMAPYEKVTIENALTGKSEKLSGSKSTEYLLSAFEEHMRGIFYEIATISLDEKKEYDKTKEVEKERIWNEKYEIEMKKLMEITGKSREEILADIEKHKKKNTV